MGNLSAFLGAVAVLFALNASAVDYYEDDRSMGSDVAGLPHYRSPEEACLKGVLVRKVQGYQEADNRQYRYRSANVGTDDGFAEFACQGVIERRFYYAAAPWVTVETVATNVYGPFGTSETCTLGGFQDPETGQCGPPKCTNSCCDRSCGNGSNPIQSASGDKHQVETDFVGTGPFPLQFDRVYDSQRTWLNTSPVGIGWTHTYLGQITIAPPQGSSTLSEAIVYRPDGRIQRFNLSGAVWVADADVSERLSVSIDGSGDYVSATYTTNDDAVETYDQLGRLASITNRDGFTQTLNYTTGPAGSVSTISHNFVQQVTDPQGRTLTFGYNGSDQLTSLTDGNSQVIQYAYDGNGNLHTATYPDVSGTKVRTYAYDETGQTGGATLLNALTGITDENSQRYASWGYSNTGHANLSVHGAFVGGTIDRTSLVFNPSGTTTITDGLGQARTFTFAVHYLVARYTALNQPCDYCGTRDASRTYDGNGYPSGSTDFRSYQNGYTYNTRGLEAQRIEAVGQTEQRTTNTTWDASFRVPDARTVVNHSAVTETQTHWVYNTRGQPTARCDYDLTVGGIGSYTCSASGTPPTGIRRWTYTYCDAVNLAAPDPIGSVGENLAKGCPLVGLLRRLDGPRTDVSDITTYQYWLVTDSSMPPNYQLGDRAEVIDALGHITQFLHYDGNGRVLRMQDANNVIIDMTYHSRGWLLTRTVRANANGSPSVNDATTTMTYDGVGNLMELSQPDGVYFAYTYDNAHRLTNITDDLGNHIDYTLDALGHRTAENTYSVSNAVTPTRILTRMYNTLSRMTDQLNAQSADTQFGYDGNGNRMDQTDPSTASPASVRTHTTYDGLNRLATTVGDYLGSASGTANSTTSYAFDTRDNVTQITDPATYPTNYTFDGLNNLRTLQSPDTGTTNYTVDAAGNRLTQTDARGITATYGYDALNRLTSITYPTTSLNMAYSYDQANTTTHCANSYPVGRLTTVTDNSGSTIYCYDLRGNVIQKTQAIEGYRFVTSYSYNLADRLATITYPSGSLVTYTRDTDGRIQTVAVTPPGNTSTPILSSITWQPFGPATTYTFAQGGQSLTKTVDQNYWLTDITSNASSVLNLHFARDGVGNIDKLGTTPGASPPTEQYVYDALYRLTDVENGSGSDLQDFTYNTTGDRLAKTLDPSPAQTYTYTLNSHQLENIGTNPRMLDANGNTTEITSTAILNFTFDNRNRMTQVNRSGPPITNYNYDAKGERVYKTTTYPASDTRWFVNAESGNLLGEYTANSVQEYIWADSTPIAILTASNIPLIPADRVFANGFESAPIITAAVDYVHTDQLDTPRAVTTTTGTTVWNWPWQTNPFGETPPTTGTLTLNLRYPGQYYDAETGLSYNYFRDYESATGRYVESDPVGMSGGPNTYAYVSSEPLMSIDPAGLVNWKGTVSTIGVIPGGGAQRFVFNLTSDCVNGKQGVVRVVAGGPTVGFGVEIAATQGQIEFTDDLNNVDPFVFEGRALYAGIGHAFQFIGWSATAFQLGGATSIGNGYQYGWDLSVFGGAGISRVDESNVKPCCNR